jgi:polyphosphate glucokinase
MEKILGIDVGATGIKGNLVDVENGVIVDKRLKIKTPAKSTPANVLGVMNEIIEHFDWKGKPVGVGFPAIVQHGKTMSAANVDNSWLGFSARKFLEKGTGCPLSLVNDADAAGIAEIEFGQGKGVLGTVILVTLGTGLGSALFHDGKLIPNTELGHLKWKDKVIEKYMSNKVREINNMSWKSWGKELNKGLSHIDFLFSPDLIVLGGGISKKFNVFSAYLNGTKSKIVAAEMKNDAGIIGAAMSFKTMYPK